MGKIRKAIAVREILKLNKNKHIFGYLNEFGPGTKFILPVIKKTRHFLLDSEVATVYHQTKFYYQILEQSLRKSFRLIEEELKKDKANKRQAKAETKATSPANSAIRETTFHRKGHEDPQNYRLKKQPKLQQRATVPKPRQPSKSNSSQDSLRSNVTTNEKCLHI